MASERNDPDPPAPDVETPSYCTYTSYEHAEESPETLPATGADATGVEAAVWDALYDVEDPEMPISIVDLGLIYGVTVEDARATVDMTLTYTGCPARDLLMETVRRAVDGVEGVEDVEVRLVWNPGWSVDMVTDAGKESLREFGLSV